MEKIVCEDCKWIEIFENYSDEEKYLCHQDVNTKRINSENNCKNCPFYEKMKE